MRVVVTTEVTTTTGALVMVVKPLEAVTVGVVVVSVLDVGRVDDPVPVVPVVAVFAVVVAEAEAADVELVYEENLLPTKLAI